MAELYKKKLSCLAFCNLIVTKDQQILSRLGQVLSCCTSVLVELESDDAKSEELNYPEVNQVSQNIRTEEHRRKMLCNEDMSVPVNLRQYLMKKLQQAAQTNQQNVQALLQGVDPTILQGLQPPQQSPPPTHRISK